MSPPVDEMLETVRLYDLFSADTYQYIGTVEAPERMELVAGDAHRVAGVQKGEFDEQSVRVMWFGDLPSH